MTSQLQCFSNAYNFSVSGLSISQNNCNYMLPNPLDRLYANVASNAFHNSRTRFDPPKCHRRTRTAIIEHLRRKILGEIEPEYPITRLSGPAGAGKSAIMQTIAELCDKEGHNVASFFFWKSDPTRNHPGCFVATICYQLLRFYPQIEPMLQRVLSADPLIFGTSIENQLSYLIGEPLELLFRDWLLGNSTLPPCLIIIDGLDESLDKAQRCNLVHAIAHIFRRHSLPLTFFISTRPEIDIMGAFNKSSVAERFKPIILDHQYKPDNDIRIYLQDLFSDIVATHPRAHLIPANWPDSDIIQTLVRKSSGQFIFASVVMKFISQCDGLPHRQLDIVMGLQPASSNLPFVELDAMYMHLMSLCLAEDIDLVKAIIKLVQFFEWSTARFIDDIADVLGKYTDDIHIAITPLLSIMSIRHHAISIDHASFADFLSDKQRSGVFFLGNWEEQQLECQRLVVDAIISSPTVINPYVFLHLLEIFHITETEKFKHIKSIFNSFLNHLCLDSLWISSNSPDHTALVLVRICTGNFSFRLQEQALSILRREFDKYMSTPCLTTCLIGYAYGRLSLWSFPYIAVSKHFRHLDSASLELLPRDRKGGCWGVIWEVEFDSLLEIILDNALPGHEPRVRRRHIDDFIILALSPQHGYSYGFRCHIFCSNGTPRKKANLIHAKHKPRIWRTRRVERRRKTKLTKLTEHTHEKCFKFDGDYWMKALLHLIKYCSTSHKFLTFLQSHLTHIPIHSHWTWAMFKAVHKHFSTEHHPNELIDIDLLADRSSPEYLRRC